MNSTGTITAHIPGGTTFHMTVLLAVGIIKRNLVDFPCQLTINRVLAFAFRNMIFISPLQLDLNGRSLRQVNQKAFVQFEASFWNWTLLKLAVILWIATHERSIWAFEVVLRASDGFRKALWFTLYKTCPLRTSFGPIIIALAIIATVVETKGANFAARRRTWKELAVVGWISPNGGSIKTELRIFRAYYIRLWVAFRLAEIFWTASTKGTKADTPFSTATSVTAIKETEWTNFAVNRAKVKSASQFGIARYKAAVGTRPNVSGTENGVAFLKLAVVLLVAANKCSVRAFKDIVGANNRHITLFAKTFSDDHSSAGETLAIADGTTPLAIGATLEAFFATGRVGAKSRLFVRIATFWWRIGAGIKLTVVEAITVNNCSIRTCLAVRFDAAADRLLFGSGCAKFLSTASLTLRIAEATVAPVKETLGASSAVKFWGATLRFSQNT